MERHLKAHLYDISSAIDEIQSFFNQVPRRFDDILQSWHKKSADYRCYQFKQSRPTLWNS